MDELPQSQSETPAKPSFNGKGKKLMLAVATVLSIVLAVSVITLLLPTRWFPINTPINIKSGSSLKSLSNTFKEKHLVNSAILLRVLVTLLGGERNVESGNYMFDQPLGIYEVASRIARGNHGVATTKVTIPEGLNTFEIAKILKANLPGFDQTSFLKSTSIEEGYLFPDTYFFAPSAAVEEVILKMEDNFSTRTGPLKIESAKNDHSFEDIIIMASILEKEVRTPESRAIVSGILWKRLQIGMPLQVDATLGYVTGRGSAQLTADDLSLTNPYNSYRNKGLPPGPISNPGLEAVEAAMNPKASPYLYYLSDNNGVIHYGVTFEEHKANKARYLK